MTIVGFNFTEINVKKDLAGKGKVKISNNVSVTDVTSADMYFGSRKQSGLKFVFDYVSKYEPNLGKIQLIGEVLFVDEEKKIKEIMDEWKKSKKVKQEIMSGIFNTILTKGNIQALILSQTVNLPPPIPMPKVNAEAPAAKK